MSRLGRVGRRPDAWATPHDRARSRAAERLDAPLEANEAAWLDGHLAECPSCLAAAQAYEVDQLALRSLRDVALEPPRDLWARTSAAIEQEAAGHRRASTGPARRSPVAQWGAVAGIAVVAVVVGSSVLQGSWWLAPGATAVASSGSVTVVLTPAPQPTGAESQPGATPMIVHAGAVGWFDVAADGSYAYNLAPVDEVCADPDRAACAALDRGVDTRIALTSSPKSIITSPADGQAIVVGVDGLGGNEVFVVALPGDPAATPSPSPGSTPTVTAEPTSTPQPSVSTSTDPSSPPASEPPSPTPSIEISPSPSPTGATLAIVSGVAIVGDAAAFSPDGAWFAFTARPADGSAGPDIYVWRVGDAQARAVTTDGRSAFGSWANGLIIGSRSGPPPSLPAPGPSESPDSSLEASLRLAETFSIDPTTGDEIALEGLGWRPTVDPAGTRAVVWDGFVAVSDDSQTIVPADGRLVLVDWPVEPEGQSTPAEPIVVGEGPIGDFTVRWDETGSWLAVWLADASDPSLGRLSLLHVDPEAGTVDRPDAAPQDVPALPGFSIKNGRLAWATPPSQDGEGSRVQIVAWTVDGVGTIESAPGQDVIVVR